LAAESSQNEQVFEQAKCPASWYNFIVEIQGPEGPSFMFIGAVKRSS
jgi:hypothetical protein